MDNKKELTVSMRLSKADNEYINEQANRERLTLSSWIRRTIFINKES